MSTSTYIDVAIIGGGFSGAGVAYHLARLRPDTSIAVFEPRDIIGGGLAYDDADPAHRINVPAKRMSLLPDDDEHFARWIAETGADLADRGIVGRDGALYPQRAVFGRYVASHIEPLLRDGRVVAIKSAATDISRHGGGTWRVTARSGEVVIARYVIIATTHPAPDVPEPLKGLQGDSRLVADALAPGALAAIPRDARVVIVGTGLTMADVVASIDRLGHRGPITALSRRGLRSRGHAPVAVEPFGDFQTPPALASDLVAQIRTTIAEARAAGLTWHAVIDAVRAHAQTFWPKLSLDAKRRIVRHLRVYWDVHRFRIAPQVEDVLERRIRDGSLSVVAASLTKVEVRPDRIELDIRERRHSATRPIEADRVVLASGPGHVSILSTQPHLASLAAARLITVDPLGLGIACSVRSEVLRENGEPQPTLLVAGPLARGTFGELMGLPQVSAHALSVARTLAASLDAETVAPSASLAAAK